jgi:hypothetical protein
MFMFISLFRTLGQAGSLDPSFGTDGKVYFNFSNANANSENGLKSYPPENGKLMVLFNSGGVLLATRLLSDGQTRAVWCR